jgi:TetR/AcrR family transcriptional regulator
MVRKSNGGSMTAAEAPQPFAARARRYDARRDAILRAAAGIFRTRGFAETGMRDIAVAADLSPANLYHYFRGKDEILYYCQDRALDRMLASITAARHSTPRARERLHAVLVDHVLTMLDEVEGASAHLQVEALAPALRARIVRKRDRYERALRRLVAEGIREGAFADGNAALLTRAILGALNWTVTWYRPGGSQTPRQIAEAMSMYLVRGLVGKVKSEK